MNSIALRKQLFMAVRDIPYQLTSEERDTSCGAKTKLLGDLLTRIGLKCRIVTGVFYWRDLGLPNKILSKAKRQYTNHIFLQVYIPESAKWVDVDPTWDPGLQSKLPVATWNGLTSTKVAVSLRDRQIVRNSLGTIRPFDYSFRNFNSRDPFTKALNCWYGNIRKGKHE